MKLSAIAANIIITLMFALIFFLVVITVVVFIVFLPSVMAYVKVQKYRFSILLMNLGFVILPMPCALIGWTLLIIYMTWQSRI